MAVDLSILGKLLSLPLEQLRQVVELIESVRQKAGNQRKAKRMKGLCADLGVQLDEEDITGARREMCAGFPREDL